MSVDRPLRVMVVPFTRSSLGHLIRSMASALELQRRGHAVLFACAEQVIHIPRAAGLTCEAVHELEPMPPWSKVRSQEDLRSLTRRRLANPDHLGRCLEDESALIRRFKPDLVLSDLRNTAGVAAALVDIPSISLHNTKLFIYPLSEILPMVMETMATMGLPQGAIRKVLGDIVVIPDFSRFEPLTAIPESVFKLIASSVREIRYVGPILRREPADLPSKSQLKHELGRPDRPLVLVTFGGSASGASFLPAVLRGLVGLEGHFVIVTGPNVLPEEIAPLTTEIERASPCASTRVYEYTDRTLEYMKAADVAIIHGGHGTTMEGILCGTPLICIPHNAEQAENAQRSVDLGIGRLLGSTEIETNVASCIKAILGDTDSNDRCARVAATFGRSRGAAELANFIETTIWLTNSNFSD